MLAWRIFGCFCICLLLAVCFPSSGGEPDAIDDVLIQELVVVPLMKWYPHSLRITREIDMNTEDIISSEASFNAENKTHNYEGREDSGTEIETRDTVGTAGTGLEATAGVSVGSFGWHAKAGFEAKASASASLSDSFHNERSTKTFWSSHDQQALTRQHSEVAKSVTTVNASKTSLDFAIRFVNTNDFPLYVDPNSSVPVYCGDWLVLEARLAKPLGKFVLPEHSEIDLMFRGNLTNTNDLEKTVNFMRQASPTIRLERGQFHMTKKNEKGEDEPFNFRMKELTTAISCGGRSWNVRRTWNGRDVTLREALRGINAIYEKPPFQFGDDGRLKSVLDIKPGEEFPGPVIVWIQGNEANACVPELDGPLGDKDIAIEILELGDVGVPTKQIYIEKLGSWAKQGDAKAQWRLGECYRDGFGVKQNDKKAAEWFRKSAEQGNAAGQWRFGECCRDGIGVVKNAEEGAKWFQKSAEQGNAKAQWRLGECYRDGLGVKQNGKKAAEWFRKSAEQGNAAGQWRLGECYLKGIGVDKNLEEAAKWFQQSADQGNPNGQWRFGERCLKGEGVDKDDKKATEMFRLSAEQGNAKGQCALGECYLDGIGVKKNREKGEMWLRKAAKQGDKKAIKLLEKISGK